jgi:hypothetical protein
MCGDLICAQDDKATCLDNKCECKEGYSTVEDSLFHCCYIQKSFKTAFLLELILSFGLGHFYRGATYLGLIKFLIYFLFVSSFTLLFIKYFRIKKKRLAKPIDFNLLTTLNGLLAICTYISWQMIDLILFFSDVYQDENGVALA